MSLYVTGTPSIPSSLVLSSLLAVQSTNSTIPHYPISSSLDTEISLITFNICRV
jgi:hypothetical protein